MRAARRWVGIAVLLLACAGPAGIARAAGLRVQAPEECTHAIGIQAQVEGLVGRPLAEIEGVDFELEVSREAGGEYLLVLRTLEEGRPAPDASTRELRGKSCNEVCDAAAVAIALSITGEPDAREPAAETAVQPKSPAPATTPAAKEPEPQPAAAREPGAERIRFSLALGAALDFAVLPAPSPGVQVELAAGYAALSLRLYGAVFADQLARLPGSDHGAELGLTLFGAMLCGERELGPLRALGCGGGELGSLSGSGYQLRRSEQKSSAFRGLRAELGLAWAFAGGFSLIGRGGVAVPLTRDEFQVGGVTVHRPPGLSGRALVGVALEL